MLRNIKISVDAPYIDSSSSLEHTGTSYQVSKTLDFSNTDDLIVNVSNDSDHLLEYFFEYDFQNDEPIYTRTKYHFNNNTESDWSMVIPHNSQQVGFKTSNTIVATPVIITSFDFNRSSTGELVIKLENLNLLSGIGNVNRTSWVIQTLEGNVVYNIPKSSNYVDELRLPLDSFSKNKGILVKATTHTDTNADSNTAEHIVVFKTDITYNFEAELDEVLYFNTKNYVLFKNKKYNFTSFDLQISTPDGSVVETFENLNPDIGIFEPKNIEENQYYVVKVRGIQPNEPATNWQEIYSGPAFRYRYSIGDDILDNTINYRDNLVFTGYTNFNGLSSQTLVADKDNVFYIGIPETDKIELWRAHNNGLYPVGKEFTLPGGVSAIPNINTLPLANRDLVIDYNLPEDGSNPEFSRFAVFKYNHINKKLTLTKTFNRTDERYSTGRNGSAVATKEGLIYYVPAEIHDSNNNELDLEMRVYDPVSNSITKHIPLPVSGLKHDVSLALGPNDKLYLFGGSGVDQENDLHGEISNSLINNKIYVFDFASETWTELKTVSLLNSNSYRYKLVPLLNGKLAIIDSTPDVVDGGDRYSYIYNTYNNSIESNFLNNPKKEHIGVTIQMYNGDVILMSSTADTVETVSYLTTTLSNVTTGNAFVDYSEQVTDLVVPVGETVYIRDPYRYESITIEGDSVTNTGKLVWINDHVAEVFDYNDLIVTRDMTITEVDGQPETEYDKVVVVGDATLTIVEEDS